MRKDMFKYRVDDYVIQKLMHDLSIRAHMYQEKNMTIESTLLQAAITGLALEEENDIRSVMKSFYNIINHKNFDDIRTLWLPDQGVELLLPG